MATSPLTRVASFVLALGLVASCDRGDRAAETDGPPPVAPTPTAEVATVPCELATAEAGIQGLQLRSADGACRMYLPAEPVVGELPVRVSAVGDDGVAAVEAATADGTLFATAGTVTVTAVEGGRITGRIDAEDTAEPVTGRIDAAFDVPLEAP